MCFSDCFSGKSSKFSLSIFCIPLVWFFPQGVNITIPGAPSLLSRPLGLQWTCLSIPYHSEAPQGIEKQRKKVPF